MKQSSLFIFLNSTFQSATKFTSEILWPSYARHHTVKSILLDTFVRHGHNAVDGIYTAKAPSHAKIAKTSHR